MIVESRTSLEVCLDGSVRKEFLLDRSVTRMFITYLGSLGTLEYFPSFARPFYRITRPGCYIIKGVEGDPTFQVLFIQDALPKEEDLIIFIESFEEKSA